MKKMIQGIIEFRSNLSDDSKEMYSRLAHGQDPDALFIACSDSRIVPNVVATTNPGDLFVLRNIGNLIPPPSMAPQDDGTMAVIEFAVDVLQVSDIIICGHSDCGAMRAICQGLNHSPTCSHLHSWLKYGKASLDMLKSGHTFDNTLEEHNQLSQVNVLQQMKQIQEYPLIKDRIANNKLRIHGWWFDIAKADIYCYEELEHQFILIDEKEGHRILRRL